MIYIYIYISEYVHICIYIYIRIYFFANRFTIQKNYPFDFSEFQSAVRSASPFGTSRNSQKSALQSFPIAN